MPRPTEPGSHQLLALSPLGPRSYFGADAMRRYRPTSGPALHHRGKRIDPLGACEYAKTSSRNHWHHTGTDFWLSWGRTGERASEVAFV